MQINITVRNQSIIDICPCVVLAEDSQNYVTAVFTFLTDDWDNTEKTAQFQNPKTGEVYESILDSSNACTVRWEALSDSGDMNVAVFGVNGGYRVTTNMGVITVLPTLSGGESDTPPSPDVYQQLLTMLGQKADNMTYSDNVLKLLSGSKELARVIIAGGGSSAQPDWNQNDSGAADYIKNRPFYDDTNVLLEWDGNTEGLVAATTTEEVGGIPAGTAVAYKIAEYMAPESFVGATEIDSDGSSLAITEEDIEQVDGITYVRGLALADKSIVAQNVSFPEAGAYTFTANDVYVSKVYTGGIVKLPNKYLNLDTALNKESENPVQNKAIAAATAKVPLMVRLSMGQGISFSESYDTIEQALESRRPVIGIVDSYKGEDLVLPYFDVKNNIVYFDISSANTRWKYGKIGRSGGGYDATEYAADLPALTPDGRETNAGMVVAVDENGRSYELKKLTATAVGALSGTTANSWADVPELLANYDIVLYNTTYGNRPEGLRPPALIVAAATERGTRQLSILDGAGQIWTGSVDLSSGTITVKKVDAGIQTLNLGAASDVDIRELEEGICRVITDSGEINLNGFNGSVAGSGTPVTMATYSTNCLYLAVSREESSSGITIVVNVMDQAMPTQIVCEANGTGNYASWTSTKTNIKDICLSKDNTTEYTPTGDYNPATKKYVDDAAGNLIDRQMLLEKSIENYYAMRRTGKVYQTKLWKFASNPTSTGEKLMDNDGLVFEPSTDTEEGQDDYLNGQHPLFEWVHCNYIRDDDGTARPIAIEGTDGYKTTGSVDVGAMQMSFWWKWDASNAEYDLITISDLPHPELGLKPWPECVKLDGTVVPWCIGSAYVSGEASDGLLRSQPGLKPARSQSHNNMITNYQQKGDGYWGAGAVRNTFQFIFNAIKGNTKNSQTLYQGCTNYSYQYEAAVQSAESHTYFPVTNAQAASLVVGSYVSVGYAGNNNGAENRDRGQTTVHAYADDVKILSIETLDESNMAVYLDIPKEAAFNTQPHVYTEDFSAPIILSMMHWWSGSTDAVKGRHDGSLGSNTDSKHPYRVQGREYAVGAYIVASDTVMDLQADYTKHVLVAPKGVTHSSSDTTIRSTYTQISTIPAAVSGNNSDWWIGDAGLDEGAGSWYPSAEGSSPSQGCGDRCYAGGATATPGLREYLQGGNLWFGAGAGSVCLYAGYGLGGGLWYCAACD